MQRHLASLVAAGKAIPTELRREEGDLRDEIALEDEKTEKPMVRGPSSTACHCFAVNYRRCGLVLLRCDRTPLMMNTALLVPALHVCALPHREAPVAA